MCRVQERQPSFSSLCKSWMSSNFGQIGLLTMELTDLESLKIFS